MERKLTERQKRFADFFLELGNASRAAERAGYCPKYAVRLRRQPAVQEYLRGRIEQLDKERVASADEVLEYLTGVMRGSEGGTAAMKAAELLGKRLGLFTEREEAPPAPVIVDDIPEEK